MVNHHYSPDDITKTSMVITQEIRKSLVRRYFTSVSPFKPLESRCYRSDTSLSGFIKISNGGYIRQRPVQYRSLCTSDASTEEPYEDKKDEGLQSDGAPSNEVPLINRDTFIRLISSINDKNTGLLLALDRFKDEIQSEGERSYPFRARDLRVLLGFCSNLLSLHNGGQSTDTLLAALDLFNEDGASLDAFHLCRLFSSLNNCHGKTMTSSIFKRVVHNNVGLMAAKFISPKTMEKLSATYQSGAQQALNYIATSITDGDLTALQRCCDRQLFEFIQRGKEYLDRIGLRLQLEISEIKHVKLDNFLLTIGGKRGEEIQTPYVMKQAMAHQIIVSLPKERRTTNSASEEGMPLTRQQTRELVLKSFEKGVIARMEVLLTARQGLSLLDKEDNVLWQDSRKLCTHKLTFESEVDMKSRDEHDFETKDWGLVDINGILNSNAPFTN